MKKKIRTIILIVAFFIVMLAQNIYATSTIDPDDYKPPAINTVREQPLIDLGNKIVGGIMAVGTVVAVVMVMVTGIQYMTGSIEQKAEYKKTLGPKLLGAFLIFSTCTLIKLIFNIVTNIDV